MGRLLLEGGASILLEGSTPTLSYNNLLDAVVKWIAARVNQSELNNICKISAINSRSDYENLSSGLMPFIGVAIPQKDLMAFETLQVNYPVVTIQVIYAFRSSGSVPEDDMTVFLEMIQDLEDLLLYAQRHDQFGLQNYVASMKVMAMYAFPSFYTTVDKNRKSFSIGFFPIQLQMSGI